MSSTRVSAGTFAVRQPALPLITIYSLITLLAAAAQPGHAQGLMLEEIIVTAQKREESLSEVPVTVNVIGGKEFEQSASFSFQDVARLTAGLEIGGGELETDIALRGLGTRLDGPVDKRVTVYFDGTHVSQERGLFVAQFDLERFQVLRGPQGTLYSKASPAGALLIESRSPNLTEMEGLVQQAFTTQAGTNSQLALSVPIVPGSLAVRLAGVYDENEQSDIRNIARNTDSLSGTTGGRIVVAWQPWDSLDVRLSHNYVLSKFDAYRSAFGSGEGSALDQGNFDFDERNSIEGDKTEILLRNNITVLNVDYQLPNEWLLTYVGSLQNDVVARLLDGDRSDFPLFSQNQDVRSDVGTIKEHELRLASQGNDFWDWTAGLYYADRPSVTTVDSTTDLSAFGFFITTLGTIPLGAEERAVFTHNSIHISERATLTLGLRYQEIENSNSQLFEQEGLLAGTPFPAQSFDLAEFVPEDQRDVEDDAFTGTVKFQYQFNEDWMVYTSYDRGWRKGTANISRNPLPPELSVFEPESSDNFEVGSKWSFAQGRGLLNVSLFYQTYDDFQFGATTEFANNDSGGTDILDPVVNVAEVSVQGFDLEVNFAASERLYLSASASYAKTELEDAAAVPCNEPAAVASFDYAGNGLFSFPTCDFAGEAASGFPEWSGVFNAEYSIPLGAAEFFLRGLIKGESDRFDRDTGLTYSGYGTADIFTGFRAPEGRWEVSVWVKNLFEKTAIKNADQANVPISAQVDPAGNPYLYVVDQLDPRTGGVTLRYRF